MPSKKIYNTLDTFVSDAVDGLLLLNPNLRKIGNYNILVRYDIEEYKKDHITLISGGGSGHEPAHAGFIGDGMLACAVLGNVFASPSVNMILAAIRVCNGPKGVLLIVKNYTGDRLNFGVAVERAKQEGIRAKMIIIDDDAAFPITKGITGGRGLAGTLFVHKVAGALSIAPAGYDLDYIHSYLSENIVPFTRTLGVALTTCTVPGTPASDRLSASDSYEVGLGIHGEPGREKCILPQKDIAKSIAATLVSGCLDIAELPVPEPETDSLDMMVSLDVEINVSDHIIPVSEPEMTVTEVNESDVATDSAIDTDPTIAISTSLVDEHATIESEAISEDVAFDEVQSTPQKGPVTSDSDTQPTVPVPASILKSESDSNIKYPESTPLKRPSVTPRTRLRNTPSSSLITPSKGSFRFNFAEPVIERRPQRLPINAGSTDELVLIINNLGSLPIIEMYVLAKEVLLEMKRHKLNPVRVYMGHFMTSLDMSGCSLSVLNTTYASEMPDEIPSVLSLLDVETSAPAWMNSQVIDMLNTDIVTSTVPYNEADFHNASSEVILTQSKVAFSCAVALTLTKQICLKLIEVEPILTKYDQICGDGDCGLVMKAGASKILADIYGLDVNAQEFNLLAALKTISTALLPDEPTQVTLSSQVCKACGHNPAFLCDKIATCISESMGGTSGILLEICFRTMSTYILELDPADVGEKLWIDALDRGVTAIQNYGGATVGMRTMLDAFVPAIAALHAGHSVKEAAQQAEAGADATKSMNSLAGRSNYINQDILSGTPDPGAVAVACAFATAAEVIAFLKGECIVC